MKILNIIQCTNLGGMERSNLARLEVLNKDGHDCHLLSLNAFGDLLPLLEKSLISHSALDYGKSKIKTYIALRKHIREQGYDIIICTGHNLVATLALSGRRKGCQIMCIHFHHTGVKPDWFWKFYYGLAVKKFGHIFFNSSFIHKEALALSPVLEDQSSTLPNIYESSALHSADVKNKAKDVLGIHADVRVVANAGWLIPRKRFDVFLETAVLIKKQVPGVVFLIAGDGACRAALQKQAESLGLKGDIHWMGWVKNIGSVYDAADLVVFNTDWDAVARTPIEAGMRGTNVVCSEINGGLSDLFDNPEWILDTHDCPALAEMAVRFLTDPQLCTSQIQAIRATISEKCSPSVHLKCLLEKVGYGHE